MDNCPICRTELINIGQVKDFEDDKENYACKGCGRIWAQEDEEIWFTRPAQITITQDPKEGIDYSDCVKLVKPQNNG